MSGPATLAERVLKQAGVRGLKLATAESCTAGCLATLLADAPGGGEQFHGGSVAYSKEQKTAVLGVAPELIAAHTAVSQAVAEGLAMGVIERCPADLAIAITGVAGPEPGEDCNPVGLMHVAVARRGGNIRHRGSFGPARGSHESRPCADRGGSSGGPHEEECAGMREELDELDCTVRAHKDGVPDPQPPSGKCKASIDLVE
jgi:nicotinamide-nucleotide amidase